MTASLSSWSADGACCRHRHKRRRSSRTGSRATAARNRKCKRNRKRAMRSVVAEARTDPRPACRSSAAEKFQSIRFCAANKTRDWPPLPPGVTARTAAGGHGPWRRHARRNTPAE